MSSMPDFLGMGGNRLYRAVFPPHQKMDRERGYTHTCDCTTMTTRAARVQPCANTCEKNVVSVVWIIFLSPS